MRPIGRDDRVWLFDLDNTLHDASEAIFEQIDQRMRSAVARLLALPPQAADRLRKQYWKRYGATAIGLARHHDIDMQAFLHECHDFDIGPLVRGEPGLAQRLRRFPGRRIILTNAPADYARRVLMALRIWHEFDGLWSIEHMMPMGFGRPKPSVALMRQIVATLGVPASHITLIDDTLANLKAARRAGLRTVHHWHPGTPFSGRHHGRNAYVDQRIRRLAPLLIRPGVSGTPGRRGRAQSGSGATAWSAHPPTASAPPGARRYR